ncbi:carbon storage regulator [Pseudolysinimonas sp.]
MLVVTRKKGEKVLIGDDIVVTVIDVRRDGVRVGVDAPRGIRIQRLEVVEALAAANAEAAGHADESTGAALAQLLGARSSAPTDSDSAAS